MEIVDSKSSQKKKEPKYFYIPIDEKIISIVNRDMVSTLSHMNTTSASTVVLNSLISSPMRAYIVIKNMKTYT